MTPVRWTSVAASDFKNLSAYLEEHASSPIAGRVARRIYRSVDLLAQFPEMGRAGRVSFTRELVVTGLPYIVVYRIRPDAVQILRILHAAQKWP